MIMTMKSMMTRKRVRKRMMKKIMEMDILVRGVMQKKMMTKRKKMLLPPKGRSEQNK
jgi:hypothetical protein